MNRKTVEGILSVIGLILFVYGLGVVFRGGLWQGLALIVGAFVVWQVSYSFRN